jgi:phage tail-like protein
MSGQVIPARRNGHGPVGQIEPSRLLEYLPAIYSADPFVGRFLRIFEEVLNPLQEMVDNQPYYFDPMTAPVDILDYMAEWVDLDEGDDWSLDKRRAIVEAAAGLYRIKGTKEGIRKHLGIYSGGMVLVLERTQGFRLDGDARLGLNTSIGENRPHTFSVTVVVPNPAELDVDTIRAILDADKPVDTSYVLRIIKLPVKRAKRKRK